VTRCAAFAVSGGVGHYNGGTVEPTAPVRIRGRVGRRIDSPARIADAVERV